MSLRDEFLKATDTPEAMTRALHGAEMEMRRLDEKIAELEAQLAAERARAKRLRLELEEEHIAYLKLKDRLLEERNLSDHLAADAGTMADYLYDYQMDEAKDRCCCVDDEHHRRAIEALEAGLSALAAFSAASQRAWENQ